MVNENFIKVKQKFNVKLHRLITDNVDFGCMNLTEVVWKIRRMWGTMTKAMSRNYLQKMHSVLWGTTYPTFGSSELAMVGRSSNRVEHLYSVTEVFKEPQLLDCTKCVLWCRTVRNMQSHYVNKSFLSLINLLIWHQVRSYRNKVTK